MAAGNMPLSGDPNSSKDAPKALLPKDVLGQAMLWMRKLGGEKFEIPKDGNVPIEKLNQFNPKDSAGK